MKFVFINEKIFTYYLLEYFHGRNSELASEEADLHFRYINNPV